MRLFGENSDLGFGGKGANQAVAARLCGADVLMAARVGSDLFGEATLKNLTAFGIDTTHVTIVPGAPTGVAPIFVEPSAQNRIIVVKGANDHLPAEYVGAAAGLLRRIDTIILQFEIPVETVYHTVRFAEQHSVRCVANPAPAVPAHWAQLTDAELRTATQANLGAADGGAARGRLLPSDPRAQQPAVRRVASTRWLTPLLERGVRIFLQPNPFSRTKVLVVDGAYAQIRSANLDPRRLRLNFEVVVEIYCADTCRPLAEYVSVARKKIHILNPGARAVSRGRGAPEIVWHGCYHPICRTLDLAR